MKIKDILKSVLAWLFVFYVLVSVLILFWHLLDVFDINVKDEIEIPSGFGFYYLVIGVVFIAILICKLIFNKVWNPPVGLILTAVLIIPPVMSVGFDCLLWSHGYVSCSSMSRKHFLIVFVKDEEQCKKNST